jgi:hypothetical protein
MRPQEIGKDISLLVAAGFGPFLLAFLPVYVGLGIELALIACGVPPGLNPVVATTPVATMVPTMITRLFAIVRNRAGSVVGNGKATPHQLS